MEVVKIAQKSISDLKQSMDVICNKQENLLNENNPESLINDEATSSIEKLLNEIKAITHSMGHSKLHNLLQEKLENLESNWNDFTLNVKKQYEELNERLSILEKKKIISNKHFIKKIWASIWAPRIGILYHHTPKLIKIPKKYNKNKSMKMPLISIVTPSFNQGNFIEKTLTSVLYQKYPALEYIVQDGGSTDATCSILDKYKNLFKFCESKRDDGQTHAINLGFTHANGEIMAYLNSDDILLPGALVYVAKYFETHPDVDVVYGHRILIDEFDHEIGRWVLPPHDNKVLSWADYIPQESLFWRRRIWNKIGAKLDESFRFAMDWDMILRFRDAGAKFVRLPRFLGGFRVHINQKTSSQIENTGAEEIKRIRTRCHGKLVSHYEIAHHIRSYKIKHIIYHNLYKLGLLRY